MDAIFRGRVRLAEGERRCDVGVRDGVIASIDPEGASEGKVFGMGDDEVLLPGLVDTHVHVNEPGRTEWEGFASATRAAAAGGVTTILDMPLNSVPPTVDVAALELKRRAALGQCHVDVGFWGGAVPGNIGDLGRLHNAGVYGFKCFLVDSGVAEFPYLDAENLRQAMHELAELGALLVVHAEDPALVLETPPTTSYADFLASRPNAAEVAGIALVVKFSVETGCRAHIVHVSCGEAIPLLAETTVTAETCPHYLTIAAEEIGDGATQFKCCPPIREDANREQLWRGLRDGIIDLVVSDHSPATVELKALDSGDFAEAWGGIASLQLGLPLVWSEARRRGFSLADVVRWMSSGPAGLVGLRSKGSIEVGRDADLVVFAPDQAWVVDARHLHHRNPVMPYDGRQLRGVVRSTWLRGVPVTPDGAPRGRLLSRGAA